MVSGVICGGYSAHLSRLQPFLVVSGHRHADEKGLLKGNSRFQGAPPARHHAAQAHQDAHQKLTAPRRPRTGRTTTGCRSSVALMMMRQVDNHVWAVLEQQLRTGEAILDVDRTRGVSVLEISHSQHKWTNDRECQASPWWPCLRGPPHLHLVQRGARRRNRRNANTRYLIIKQGPKITNSPMSLGFRCLSLLRIVLPTKRNRSTQGPAHTQNHGRRAQREQDEMFVFACSVEASVQ